VDDPHVRALVPKMTRRVITYGLASDSADLQGVDLTHDGTAWQVRVVPGPGLRDAVGLREAPPATLCTLRLQVPGRHNLQNALAAVAVGLELGIDLAAVTRALEEFHGADRRFQRIGESDGVLVIDDYGHHPTEIRAVLDAARASLGRRLVVLFQPHRYSRTERLLGAFGPAFAAADELVLTDIYAASEAPIPGVTVEALAAAIAREFRGPIHTVRTVDEAVAMAAGLARSGDAVLTLGAGSIGTAGKQVLAALAARAGERG